MTLRGYLPQLDGVRGAAIAAVVAYHLGYLGGGWLGVDVFFVLSGYLITSILLDDEFRLMSLRRFWGRRARRLLPAVLAMLLALCIYAWLRGPGLVPAQLRWPALATALYGANWQQIAAGSSYFAQFTSPGPLTHAWSLAIEEQYYVLAPLLLGALLFATRSLDNSRRRRWLIGFSAALTVVSATWMGLAEHLYGVNRAYLGTDTRAWELLLGGMLALVFPVHGAARATPSVWKVLTPAGLVIVALGVWRAAGPPAWVWDGGLVAIASGAGLVIVGVVREPDTLVSRFLGLRPVRWLGLISYSLYLWHWPAIVLITPDTSGLTGDALAAVRVAAMLAASTVSYYLIEQPLRRLDWSGMARRVHLPSTAFATAGLALTAAAVIGATVGPPHAGSSTILTASTQQIAEPVGLRPATRADPYRVWIFGDSVMFDGSPGVTAALQATGEVSVVVDTAFPGWGLARDATWAADASATIRQYHPQIVIGTWSWDDAQALKNPQAYLQRLRSALSVLLDPATGVKFVVLMQFPQSGPATSITEPGARAAEWLQRTTAQRAWNQVAAEAVKGFPGHAAYLTTDQVFAPGGQFLTWFRTSDGGWLRGRKLDNAHFCPYGAAQWGALVTADLTPALRLAPMRTGWELGSWTRDRRYNDPPGACPDDQPPGGYRGVPVPAIESQIPPHP